MGDDDDDGESMTSFSVSRGGDQSDGEDSRQMTEERRAKLREIEVSSKFRLVFIMFHFKNIAN